MDTIIWIAIWNSVLVAILVSFLLVLSRLPPLQRRPALRSALWLLVMAKLMIPPLVRFPVVPENGAIWAALHGSDVGHTIEERREFTQTADDNSRASGFETTDRIQYHDGSETNAGTAPEQMGGMRNRARGLLKIAVLMLSLGGSCIVIGFTLHRGRHIGRLLQHADGVTESLKAVSSRISRRAGLRQPPRITVIDAKVSPLLWVNRRGPTIVLPRRLLMQLQDCDIAGLLAHEIAHYVRRDHWANGFVFIVNSLFWWHPFVWIARRELREAQEVCADAWAIAIGVDRRTYARALLSVIDFHCHEQSTMPSMSAGIGTLFSLQRRVKMLGQMRTRYRLSWPAWAFALLILSLLPCTPTRQRSTAQAAKSTTRIDTQQSDKKGVNQAQSGQNPTSMHAAMDEKYARYAFDCDKRVSDPRRLPHLENVRSLALQGPRIADKELKYLQDLAGLEKLALVGTRIEGTGLMHLNTCENLEGLTLVGPHVTDEWLRHLPEMQHLKAVNLSGSRITDAGLTNLTKLPNLEWLALRDTAIGDTGLKVIQHLPRLTMLSLKHTRVSDEGLENLAHVPRLRRFSLASPNVRGFGLAHLQDLSKLTELKFVGSYVTDEWMRPLEPLESVTRLGLYSTNVTASGLAAIRDWTTLKHLYLNNTPITDEVVEKLGGLYLLNTIELTGTQATPDGVARLKEVLPGAGILGVKSSNH